MYEKVLKLLKDNDIKYEEYEHEPILSYETARKVGEELGFVGTESKSLFLKGKSSAYYVFITVEGVKINLNQAKSLVGEKISICPGAELTEVTGCLPGCASLLGYEKDVVIILDEEVKRHERLIFSPGVAEITMIINTTDLLEILGKIENKVYNYV